VREAVVAGAMPSPSPYATRAWEDTARALDAGFSSGQHALDTLPAPPPAEASRAPMIAVAAGVVALLLLALRLLLRRRGRGREQASGE
jgi:hypothetical protein